MNVRHALIFAVGLSVTACSSKPQKDDRAMFAETPGFLLRGVGRALPPLADLAFVEEAPAATSAGEVGPTSAFKIGDLRVLHKRTTANSVVQARLYVYGGAANLTEETSGIEELALQVAVSGGTTETTKDDFNARLDATGAAIFSFTDRDYSGYGLKTLTDHFDQNWELFTQAVLKPAMPDDEVSVRRAKQLASIASLLDSPDTHLTYSAGQHMFANHAYQQLHIGTKANVESFTRDELLAYQRAMLVPANLLVVVVGNVDTAALVEKVRKSFGRLASKRAAPIDLPEFTSEPGAVFAAKPLPTNYILGMFEGPAPGSPDYAPMLVATDYLRERLFEEVRTKRNLTYAVSSGLADQRVNYGYLYVTAVKPDETLPVIFAEVKKLRDAPIPAESLKQTVSVFITEHYMGLQTNASQASALAQAELTGGDWHLADQMLGQIRAVGPADVQRVAQRYLKDYRFAVVGPGSDLPQALFAGPAQ